MTHAADSTPRKTQQPDEDSMMIIKMMLVMSFVMIGAMGIFLLARITHEGNFTLPGGYIRGQLLFIAIIALINIAAQHRYRQP